MTDEPHATAPVAEGGPPLDRARFAVVALHGRGGSPDDMLRLAAAVAPRDAAILAPAAAGASWWPASFLEPLEVNALHLASALALVARIEGRLAEAGFGPDRVALLGFSQGACLALERAARDARPRRAVVALSGGLVGTADAEAPPTPALHGRTPKRLDYAGDMGGTPVRLACHAEDPHIPLARVRESGEVFARLGAAVETTLHPGPGHGVPPALIPPLRALLAR